jgi:hypothetical protein
MDEAAKMGMFERTVFLAAMGLQKHLQKQHSRAL